jgi:hypothetical protein
LTFATKEFFDTWSTPEKPKGFGAGATPQLRHIHAPGVGGHDGFYEADGSYGWMA